MLITIPATAHGEAVPASVLDLEPLIAYARQCRADAVSLMPPIGPDDLPNAAALLAMRNRLEQEGLRVMGGRWRVWEDAPVDDEGWEARTQFEARALVAALGEAGVPLLIVDWEAPVLDRPGQAALHGWLERLLEEAERAEVRLALRSSLPARETAALLRQLDTPYLGVCHSLEAHPVSLAAAARRIRSLGERLAVLQVEHAGRTRLQPGEMPERDPVEWRQVVQALRSVAFRGPILFNGRGTPVEYAAGVGFLRGLLAFK